MLLTNTMGISLSLMPFLILYAKNNFNAGSDAIGNFLILKVVGSFITSITIYHYAKRIKYKYLMYTNAALAVIIPSLILILPGDILFPYVFLVGGIMFTLYGISVSGVLLEITTNENRALHTGLTGAASILPGLFAFIGGAIITTYGFPVFFIVFICIVSISFYLIRNLNCQK